MTPRKLRTSFVTALAFATLPSAARAQPAPNPVTKEEAPSSPEAPAEPVAAPAATAEAPAAPAAPTAAQAPKEDAKPKPPPTVFPPPVTRPPRPMRGKPQVTTLGPDPAAPDFGAEADLVSTSGAPKPPLQNRRWSYTLSGFFRAPARVGIGPETGSTDGTQLHSPPRMVGRTPHEWSYINVAPPPVGQFGLTVANRRVSANLLLGGDTFVDAAYPILDELGGFTQAWVTLTWPELFGTDGGLGCSVGAFSERFGMAGPYQESSGYYGTYLFGRTHVAGESCTIDIDVGDDTEIMVEEGVGAKVEVVPFQKSGAPVAPYLPNQGPVPQGSTYLVHGHVGLQQSDWLRIAAHYLYAFSPDDLADAKLTPSRTAKLTILGGEIHADHPVAGSGYIGYSYIDARRILPLSDAVEVLHSTTGAVFKENYFGPLPAATASGLLTNNDRPGRDDSGTVQSVLLQYIIRLAPLLGRREPGADVALAVYGMLNHVEAPKTELNGQLFLPGTSQPVPAYTLKQDRFKLGGELQVSPLHHVSVGARFDRVMPDGGNADVAYSALSPRVVLHTNWLSREYIVLNYTHFFLGKGVRPSAPYDQPSPPEEPYRSLTTPDPNLISLTAMLAF